MNVLGILLQEQAPTYAMEEGALSVWFFLLLAAAIFQIFFVPKKRKEKPRDKDRHRKIVRMGFGNFWLFFAMGFIALKIEDAADSLGGIIYGLFTNGDVTQAINIIIDLSLILCLFAGGMAILVYFKERKRPLDQHKAQVLQLLINVITSIMILIFAYELELYASVRGIYGAGINILLFGIAIVLVAVVWRDYIMPKRIASEENNLPEKNTVPFVEVQAEKDKYDKLKTLKELFDDGVLTQEEYDAQKQEILNK